jgi:hypothetical protein
MFKQIYGTETVKPYHSVLSCAQNEDNRNSNNYVKFTKQKLTKYFSVHFTNRLTDFWATVNEYGVECPFWLLLFRQLRHFLVTIGDLQGGQAVASTRFCSVRQSAKRRLHTSN